MGPLVRPLNENSVDRRRRTEVTWDADRREVVLHCWYNEVTKAELSTALPDTLQRHMEHVVDACIRDTEDSRVLRYADPG